MRTPPTTDRGRESVDRVLTASAALFLEQGVRATTLDQIGDRAGVGRGQLYHFFAGKSDLVTAVAERQVDDVMAAMEPSLRAMASAEDLRAWCAKAVAIHAGEAGRARCPIGSLALLLTDQHAGARSIVRAALARWRIMFEEALRRLQVRGDLSEDAAPAIVAAGLLAAYQGGVLLADAAGDVTVLRDALAAVAEPALARRR